MNYYTSGSFNHIVVQRQSPRRETKLTEDQKIPIGTLIGSTNSNRICTILDHVMVSVPFTTSSMHDNDWVEVHKVYDQERGYYDVDLRSSDYVILHSMTENKENKEDK